MNKILNNSKNVAFFNKQKKIGNYKTSHKTLNVKGLINTSIHN